MISTASTGTMPHHRRSGRVRSHAFDFELGHLQRRDFKRADLVFEGVDHAGPSYEARIFLNNPGATAETPRTAGEGYARSFHIFVTAIALAMSATAMSMNGEKRRMIYACHIR